MEKKTIGILGGMGPLATADLFQKIVLLTDAHSDNEHIRVYMDSNSSIPDRTAALLHGGADPVPPMLDALRNLEKCGPDCIVMPCNTAHCFLPRLQPETKIPFISMPAAAAKASRERFPGKTAAILGTDGTVQLELYQKALDAEGVAWILPDAEEQAAVMRVIYEGVKAGKGPEDYGADWKRVIDGLLARGADFFILGCTELPLAAQQAGLNAPSVDPTLELAAAAIRFCGYPVKDF